MEFLISISVASVITLALLTFAPPTPPVTSEVVVATPLGNSATPVIVQIP